MKRIRVLIVGASLALFTIIPGFGAPASAAHTCGLEDVDPTVNTICDNYHNPKPLLSYLFCLVSPTC